MTSATPSGPGHTVGASAAERLEVHARRPSSKRAEHNGSTYAAMLGFGTMSVLLLIGHFHGRGLVEMVVAEALGAGAFAVWLRRTFSVSTLRLDGGELWHRNAFRPRRVADSTTARMVHVPVGPYRGMTSQYLLIQDVGGRTTARLLLNFWPLRDVQRLVELMGIPWTEAPACKDITELARAYPGSVSWPLTHPVLAALGSLALLVLLVAGVQAL